MLCEKQYYTPKESIFCFGVLQKNEKTLPCCHNDNAGEF